MFIEVLAERYESIDRESHLLKREADYVGEVAEDYYGKLLTLFSVDAPEGRLDETIFYGTYDLIKDLKSRHRTGVRLTGGKEDLEKSPGVVLEWEQVREDEGIFFQSLSDKGEKILKGFKEIRKA